MACIYDTFFDAIAFFFKPKTLVLIHCDSMEKSNQDIIRNLYKVMQFGNDRFFYCEWTNLSSSIVLSPSSPNGWEDTTTML